MKKDLNRYKELQKAYEVFQFFTEEDNLGNNRLFNLFDQLDYILVNDGETREKLDKMQKKLSKIIRRAKEEIINESKTFL